MQYPFSLYEEIIGTILIQFTYSYFSKILHRRNACAYVSTANPKNTHIILAITNDLDVNNVRITEPTLSPTITIVDGICAADRSSALRSVAKMPFSNLAMYGNRYWNINTHIPRMTASTIRITLYRLLPLKTPIIRKSTNSNTAMTAMISQQMVAGLKFLLYAFQNSFHTEGSSTLAIFIATAYRALKEVPMVITGIHPTTKIIFKIIMSPSRPSTLITGLSIAQNFILSPPLLT